MKSNQPDTQIFESIFRHATMGILVANGQGLIILANQFSLNEFGYLEEELIGQTVETLIPHRFHGQHSHERTSYQKHPETRAMGVGRDLYGRRKDGSEFPVEVSLSPFQSGLENYVIAFIIDITVRKEKEISEKEYRKKIAEILSSLRKEKELNDMKSGFVSLASHEFKTPLSTILSSASLLSKYNLTEEQIHRDKHIERIKSAVRNLNGILNEFLSISKIENGKISVHYLSFNLEEVIQSICNELQDLLKADQHIQYHHEGEKIVSMDMDLLSTIISNLLTNAIKFSEENSLIKVNSKCTAEAISIKVADNGYGISEEDKERLFERFFRGSNVLTIPGTGLGLHIVSKYVELMRGNIQINSQLNKGTEICIEFKHEHHFTH